MNDIKVAKSALLAKVTENRQAHRAIFDEAFENDRVQAIKELEQMLEEAKAGKTIRRMVSLAPPSDHTKDYDRVIKMLEMSTETEILLSEEDFAAYVMDQWRWKRDVLTSNSSYSHMARRVLAEGE